MYIYHCKTSFFPCHFQLQTGPTMCPLLWRADVCWGVGWAMNLGWAIAATGKVRRACPITTLQYVWKRPQVKNPENDRYSSAQLKTQIKDKVAVPDATYIQSGLLLTFVFVLNLDSSLIYWKICLPWSSRQIGPWKIGSQKCTIPKTNNL